jgi:phenylacetate-coenzyme A ligase PaaK-like adenylate-forming protein
MILLSALRSLGRIGMGRRPKQGDLDRMIADLRGRLQCGRRPPRAPAPRLSPALSIRLLRSVQLRKLRRTLAYAARHQPHYRRTLGPGRFDPRDLRTIEDLRRLPITERADLEDDRDGFISRAPGLTPSIALRTSGTTGRPLDLFLTREEFEYYVAVQALSGMAAGFLGPDQIVQVHMSLDTSLAAQIFSAAARRCGALVLNVGVSGAIDASLEALRQEWSLPGKRPKISGLMASPGQIRALAARAEWLGIGRDQVGLQRVFTCGALVSDDLRRLVRRVWDLPLREAWSMIETPGTGAVECDSGRLHFLDLSGLVEFLDPATREPVPPGRPGIAVVTAFHPDRELMPVIRYWSGDLMVASAETACDCGMVSTLIDSIPGRIDQMLVVGARNFFPQAMGDLLTGYPELVQPPRFRVAVEERAAAQHVVMEIECSPSLAGEARPGLTEQIRGALPIARDPYVTSGVVRFDLSLVAAGSIREPFPYKLQGPAPAG